MFFDIRSTVIVFAEKWIQFYTELQHSRNDNQEVREFPWSMGNAIGCCRQRMLFTEFE